MKIKALYIPCDPRIVPRIIDIDSSDTEKTREYIGGWLEQVPSGPNITIFCDEEGKLKQSPPNNLATVFWRNTSRSAVPFPDILVGNVLVFGPVDDEGNLTSIENVKLDYIDYLIKGICNG